MTRICRNVGKWFACVSVAILLLVSSASGFALPFTVATKAGTQLPTSVPQGNSVLAYYTLRNNTGTQRNNNFVKSLPPNVSQVTIGGTYADTCGSRFNLAPLGGSCTLQLSVSGAVNANDPAPSKHLFVCFPGGITCSGTADSLNVTVSGVPPPPPPPPPAPTLTSITVSPTGIATVARTTTQQYSVTGNYSDGSTQPITTGITWTSSSPAVATIASTGLLTGIITGTTTVTATVGNFSDNSASAFVPGFLYVTSNTGNHDVSQCPVNADGTLGSCTVASSNFGSRAAIFITFNPTATFAYFGGADMTFILNAPVNSDGTLGSNGLAGAPTGSPDKIVFNTNLAIAYVATGCANAIAKCDVNNDASINCTGDTGSGFTDPVNLALNNGSTFAYVENNNNTLRYCPINPNGTFGTCNTFSDSHFDTPESPVVNPTNTFLYLNNELNNNILICPINTNGSLTAACTAFGTPTQIGQIAMNAAGTILYYTNNTGNAVYYCPINSDGSISSCTSTGTNLTSPFGIAIN